MGEVWTRLRDLEVAPLGWFVEVGTSTDLDRITMELERIERVDLETDEPERPPELLELLGGLAERCERELGRGAPLTAKQADAVAPPG